MQATIDNTMGSPFSKTPVVTREYYEALPFNHAWSGGDCWSRQHVLFEAFSDPQVTSVWDIHITTGLWCDVMTNKGSRRIYG